MGELESDIPHGKPAEDSRGLSSASALADPCRSSLRSISYQGHYNVVNDNDLNRNISVLSCHACDYIPYMVLLISNPLLPMKYMLNFLNLLCLWE